MKYFVRYGVRTEGEAVIRRINYMLLETCANVKSFHPKMRLVLAYH